MNQLNSSKDVVFDEVVNSSSFKELLPDSGIGDANILGWVQSFKTNLSEDFELVSKIRLK